MQKCSFAMKKVYEFGNGSKRINDHVFLNNVWNRRLMNLMTNPVKYSLNEFDTFYRVNVNRNRSA